MRIASVGQAVFATAMISLGVVGLLYPDFVPVWNPVPAGPPAHQLLIYLSAVISLVTGIGFLLRRTAAMAASILLVTLLLWLLLFRLPNFLHAPLFAACWSVFPLMVVVAASLVLYVRFDTASEREHLSFLGSKNGIRIARVLYAFSLIFFGLAHFIDLKDTLALIPHWLPGHLFWAYFTGCAFVAAGLAILIGFCSRLAAALSTLQIGLFLLLVWIPIVARGSTVPFQWSEAILNAVLLAAAWMIADSYRDMPWFAADKRS
jgi:uncharacterized membrane protein